MGTYEWSPPETIFTEDEDGLNSPVTPFYMDRCRVEEYDFELIIMLFYILQEVDPLSFNPVWENATT